MKKLNEQLLIEHCSPTLANIKVANLFRYFFETQEEVEEYLNYWNQQMNSKGVYLTNIKTCNNTALIYVYRKKSLWKILQQSEVRHFLQSYGYQRFSVEDCIKYLREQFQRSCQFPHEIGVFLGYPLEDIIGFIQNKGKNYKSVGRWKVYGNAEEAEKLFYKFKKCQWIYRQQFLNGRDILQLTVAA